MSWIEDKDLVLSIKKWSIKSLLPYLVKISKDTFMVSKKYPDNCIVGRLDWQLIIMITYDKSIFSANNSC